MDKKRRRADERELRRDPWSLPSPFETRRCVDVRVFVLCVFCDGPIVQLLGNEVFRLVRIMGSVCSGCVRSCAQSPSQRIPVRPTLSQPLCPRQKCPSSIPAHIAFRPPFVLLDGSLLFADLGMRRTKGFSALHAFSTGDDDPD